MVNVGRSKRWTRASVYRMMPWQHPSARQNLPRKVLLKNAWLFDVATIEILFFSTALCTIIIVTHYANRHKVKQNNMYIIIVNFGNGEVFRYTHHSIAVFFFRLMKLYYIV